MAEFAALPLFTDAISSDCGHLSDAEFGRYMRLLILMWRTPECRVPDDKSWICRKMRIPVEQYADLIAPLVDEFCICYADAKHDQWISQKRLQKEFAHVRASVERRRAAAKKRWDTENKEQKQEQSIVDADAPTPTPTPTPTIKEAPPSSAPPDKPKKRATSLPKDFEPDLQPSIDEGLQPQTAILSLARFKDHAEANGRTQIDWMASWRLWYRNDIAKQKQPRGSPSRAEPRQHPVIEELDRRRDLRNAELNDPRIIDHER